jgi:hypothetical protein
MESHFLLLVLFAFFVSAVFATITREDLAAQLRLAATMFAGFLAAGIVLGWLMFPFPF